MTTVEKIHNEIDTAADRLLKEAKVIIDGHQENQAKAIRLQNLGFTNSELVTKIKPLVKTHMDAKAIQYYTQKYPYQKFLTEAELERICEEYDLVFAPIKHYKMDVPDKNLTDIENAPILSYNELGGPKKSCHIYYDGNRRAKRLGWPRIIDGENFESHNALAEYLKKNYTTAENINSNYINRTENYKENREGLFIAAPKSHFDLRGLKNVKKGFFSFTMTVTQDPIVFRYVKGGVQVITKWGLEASDEKLLNPTDN